jgi:hypothetical protein
MVKEPREVWSHPALAPRRSAISGDGLFAGADITAGSRVFQLGGRLVTTAELATLIADENASGRYVDTITISEGLQLVFPPDTLVHFANHSCDPNLWHAGPYDVIARRDIRAGEEVTIDYGTNSGAQGFKMHCTCGTAACRTVVTSDDWRIVELQHRYEGHWTPALAQRIEDPDSTEGAV